MVVLGQQARIVAIHPDRVQPELLMRMGASTFAQEWLPHLAKEDADRLLASTNLAGDYVEIAEAKTTERPCSRCGSALEVVDGARRALCEACGAFNAIGAEREITCPGCGAPVPLPPDLSRAFCTYCGTQVRRDA
jgi:hypothetical protein